MISPATMLYRSADTSNPEVWGLNVEYRPFPDADVPAALEAGWARHPLDVNAQDAPAEDQASEQPKRRGRPPKGA